MTQYTTFSLTHTVSSLFFLHTNTMFSPSHLKSLHPLQVFQLKSASNSSSTISFMKLKSLIHTLIVSHMCRIIRAISKVKTLVIEIFRDNQPLKYSNQKHKKLIMGSFRLHYNWCSSKSSHVLPVPARVFAGLPSSNNTNGDTSHLYYDSTWNTIISANEHEVAGDDCHDSQLAGYLQWLEEKKVHGAEAPEINEIDMQAEMFIANCHEKFRLEKQESDRRFQEMLARSM